MGLQTNKMGRFSEYQRRVALLGVGFCLIVGLILWFGMPSTTAPTAATLPPDPFQDPTAGKAHIEKLAERYGTDFDRLSANDKLFLNSIAMGHGRKLLNKTVNELKSRPSDRPNDNLIPPAR